MKISEVKVFLVADYIYVKIVTEDGLYGIGEGSLSGRSHAVMGAFEHLKPLLVGKDATRIEHIWQDIFRGTFWRGGPVLQSALAGVDIALWDLAGKALGVPTYRLLGGACRDKVLLYRHAGAGTPEEGARSCRALVDEGWRVLRLSPIRCEGSFDPKWVVRHGIDYFAAAREAVGDDIELIMEVHTRLTPPRAIALCNGIEEYDPFYVEDPIRSENPATFRTLRAHTDVPLGTGEQLPTKWAFRELIEEELIDYIRVDICHTGGITEGKKIATMAEVHYQELACHFTASPVSTAAMLHLNTSVPNCAVQEYSPPGDWMKDVIQFDHRIEDGYLVCSDAPGLGIDLNEKAAAAHPYSGSEAPRLHRKDGSLNDW